MTIIALTFNDEQIEIARKNRTRQPFAAAWERLVQPGESLLEQMALDALRWRFNDDAAAGSAAMAALWDGAGLNTDGQFIDEARDLCASANAFHLCRGHANFSSVFCALWVDHYLAERTRLNTWASPLSPLDELWQAVVKLVDLASFRPREGQVNADHAKQVGEVAKVYQDVIENWIRPQGFFAPLVEGERDGGSLLRSLQALEALVLLAELSAHMDDGVDLWGFSARGVSVNTAAAYLIYYYFFPDKWRWDKLDVEVTRAQFRHYSPLWEMIAKRSNLRDIGALLQELRPCFNAVAGLTTLTHGVAPRRGLFG